MIKKTLNNDKTADNGWPAAVSFDFLEAGLVGYMDVGQGVSLLKKETIDKMLPSMIGKPILLNHQNVTADNFKKEAVGYVTEVWYDEKTGKYCGKGLLIDDRAKMVAEKGIFVSCSYNVSSVGPGGEWHALPYNDEITGGEFQHLALVDSPRYEDSRLYVNSKGVSMVGRIVFNNKKVENVNLEALSPIQLDKYFGSLSDPGLQQLIDGEYPDAIKTAAQMHQSDRKQKKDEAMLGGGAGAGAGGGQPGTKKANEGGVMGKIFGIFKRKPASGQAAEVTLKENDKIDAAEVVFTAENGKEVTAESLLTHWNEAEKAKAEKAAAEKAALEKMNAAGEPPKHVNGDGGHVDPEENCVACHPAAKANEEVVDDPEKIKEKETIEKHNAKVAQEKAEQAAKDAEILEAAKAGNYEKLNALRKGGEALTGVTVELLSERIQRGNDRYGSAASAKK